MASVLSIVHVIVFLCCVSSDCRADNDLGAGPQKGESSKEVWPGDEENMERRAARMRREDGEEGTDVAVFNESLNNSLGEPGLSIRHNCGLSATWPCAMRRCLAITCVLKQIFIGMVISKGFSHEDGR